MLNIGRHLVARLEQWWDGVRRFLFGAWHFVWSPG
jgi:hypothetical protein